MTADSAVREAFPPPSRTEEAGGGRIAVTSSASAHWQYPSCGAPCACTSGYEGLVRVLPHIDCGLVPE